MFKKLLPFLFILFLPAYSFAVIPEICGDGIDNSLATGGAAAGTAGSCPVNYHDAYRTLGCDADCDAPDKDGDGRTSTGAIGKAGLAVTDCDDGNPGVYPGVYAPTYSGSTLIGYKLCKTDGTYDTAVLNSVTPLCESSLGPTHCFYVDYASGNDANPGTFSLPFKTLAKVSGGSGGSGLPVSPHTLIADDWVYVINGGTDTTTFTYSGYDGTTISILFETTADGTSGHEWVLKQYPGATGVFSNIDGRGLAISNGRYGKIDGLIGSAGRTTAISGMPIYGRNSDHIEIKNVYISSMGGQGDNNDACINFTNAHDTSIHNNFLKDCKRNLVGLETNNVQNIWAISHLDETVSGDGLNHQDYLNTIWYSSFDSANNGGGIRTKHGVTNSETGINGHIVAYNTISNAAFAAFSWSSSGLRGYGNRAALDPSVYYLFIWTVNGVRHEDNRFQYNTMISGLGALTWNFPYYNPPEGLLLDHNNILATPSTYAAGNNEGIISIDGYGSDADKTAFEAGHYLTSNNNCFESPNATAVFSYFRATSACHATPCGNGANYDFAGATSWKTTIGQDLASILGSIGMTVPKWKGTGSCATFGAENALANYSGTTTTTSSVPTSTVASTTTTSIAPTGNGGAMSATY